MTEMTDLLIPPAYRGQNAEVFYSADAIVTAGPADLAFLKEQAARNPRLRSRLCTHPDATSDLHEMLIVHHRDVYVRPHHHLAKAESFHLIEGAASVVFFDEAGTVLKVVPVGGPESGRPFYYRIPERVVHTFIIESEWLVFHETTQGPFDPSKTVFAAWAPDDRDADRASAYLARLRVAIEAPASFGR